MGFFTIGVTKQDLKKGLWSWLHRPFVEDYSFLNQLAQVKGRFLDNIDFFNVSQPQTVTDRQLLQLLMSKYSTWLLEAKEKGLLS